MWRNIHSWLGLFLGLLILILSLTGIVLASQVIYQAYTIKAVNTNLSVAEAIKHIAEKNSRIQPQKLTITTIGEAKLTYSIHNRSKENVIDLTTGKFQRAYKEPKLYKFVKELHRSFLLGEQGRIFPAIAGVVLSILILSGIFLLLRKVGGIRYFFRAISWQGSANQHASLGRFALIPVIIVAFTALWLSATTYHLLPTGQEKPPSYPESKEKLTPVKPWDLTTLQQLPLKNVKEIIYPIPDDWFDVWTIKTNQQYLFIDQFTGKIIAKEKIPFFERMLTWVKFLHTAEGSVLWASILLLVALAISYFALTGSIIWFSKQRNGSISLKHNASNKTAKMVILVGSEQGNTWLFAQALHQALTKAGQKTQTVAMNKLSSYYPKLDTLFILTSTYGNGDPPSSATQFLSLLNRHQAKPIRYACLAFGDKNYPNYCAFGKQVANALAEKFGAPMMTYTEINQQSAQAFSQWTQTLAKHLALPLQVDYQAKAKKTSTFQLHSKKLFLSGNTQDQSLVEIAILRFTAKKIPPHQAGDLIAIYPLKPNKEKQTDKLIPRFYSLGSNNQDHFIEICVRKQPQGLCSSWLHQLQVGDKIEGYIQINAHFHLPVNRPVILIAAGTGITPFTGMIRHNTTQQNLTLFWGGRHSQADALYAEEIQQWLLEKKLTRFIPAWSQMDKREYVQDKIRQHHLFLSQQLKAGAVIMVCGSLAMAKAVQQEFEQISQHLGLSVAQLKQQQRYLEDVY